MAAADGSPPPSTSPAAHRWPSLPVAEWEATRDTLHLWTQIVGKVRLANTPLVNHWWNVPLYVTARGLTTSLMPHPSGASFQVDLDLHGHELEIVTDGSDRRTLRLESGTIADFYTAFNELLASLDLTTPIWPVPVEIDDAVPFADDRVHGTYDPDHAHRFWQLLVSSDRVFHEFRSRFVGKVSPVHLFWGALDLAVSRFSGRTAPPHPGGAPNCGPEVMWEAYSHELSSCGYWPGGPGEGLFYSYAYPEPEGYRDAVMPSGAASYDPQLGEFVLPYEAVREAEDPDRVLTEFLQATYEAAADAADWDRRALER